MLALSHMTYRDAFCGWLPILSSSRDRGKCVWCLFHQRVHTENTPKLTHACIHCRQVAHGGWSPTGASVAVVQHQFMLQVSDSTAQTPRSSDMYTHTHTHTHTHPFTPKSFIVWSFCVDVFPWLPPPPCCYHTKQHKGKDKIPPGHRDHNVTIQCLWRPCWCGNELLKEMWNYLTKALKEGA